MFKNLKLEQKSKLCSKIRKFEQKSKLCWKLWPEIDFLFKNQYNRFTKITKYAFNQLTTINNDVNKNLHRTSSYIPSKEKKSNFSLKFHHTKIGSLSWLLITQETKIALHNFFVLCHQKHDLGWCDKSKNGKQTHVPFGVRILENCASLTSVDLDVIKKGKSICSQKCFGIISTFIYTL